MFHSVFNQDMLTLNLIVIVFSAGQRWYLIFINCIMLCHNCIYHYENYNMKPSHTCNCKKFNVFNEDWPLWFSHSIKSISLQIKLSRTCYEKHICFHCRRHVFFKMVRTWPVLHHVCQSCSIVWQLNHGFFEMVI